MRLLLCIITCCGMFAARCQDVSGIWKGRLTQSPGGCFPEYYLELQINQTSNDFTGVTYDYYDTTKYIKVQFIGKINAVTKRIVIIESKAVAINIPRDCIPCIKTYELSWSRENNEEVLTGTWKGVEMGSASSCPPGKLYLKKSTGSSFKTEDFFQDEKLAVIQKAFKPETRKVEIVKTLIVDTLRLKLELYDNGQIDGDTISIFLNDQLILFKKGLSDKPIVLNVPIQPDKEYEMIMYADNLGSIPPNTALMVVTAGKRKYEIYLSSSEQKSAAVKFKYEKKEQ